MNCREFDSKYDELSVKDLFPHMKNDPVFMEYFPDKFPKGHPPDREYFFNILHTLNPRYVKRIIAQANRNRNYVEEEEQQQNAIELS